MSRCRRRKCRHCGQLYKPDPRNRWHQQYCSTAACQEASHKSSQRRWRRSRKGRDYFQGPANLYRVRKWRKIHPGYWKKRRKKPVALRDVLFTQTMCLSGDARILNSVGAKISELFPTHLSSTASDFTAANLHALRDVLSAQLALQLGLIAHLSGALQDDIVPFVQRLILFGRQIQGQGGSDGGQTSTVPGAIAQSAAAVQLGRSPADSG